MGHSKITALLQLQIVQKPSPEKKHRLTPQSKIVADQVAKLVKSAEALKGKSLCSQHKSFNCFKGSLIIAESVEKRYCFQLIVKSNFENVYVIAET